MPPLFEARFAVCLSGATWSLSSASAVSSTSASTSSKVGYLFVPSARLATKWFMAMVWSRLEHFKNPSIIFRRVLSG